jgi:tetratricopeptide (TPR) repeat protein
VKAYNNLAWIYATSPLIHIRDGDEAVTLALKACELTDFKEPEALDTLAAAYAEAGNFEKAIEYQERAIDLCQEESKSALLKSLKLYQAGQAYRSQ